MTDHPVSAQEYRASRKTRLGFEATPEMVELAKVLDRLGVGTPRVVARALVERGYGVSVPAEPGAPDPRPVLAVCPECGRSDEHAAPCTAAHWMRLASYAPRPVTAPEPTRKPCGCIPPYQWCTRCDDGSVPAPEPSALLDVERLGASISAVEDSLVRRGLMDRLTSMDNFVLAEMVAREYLAATPQDREP